MRSALSTRVSDALISLSSCSVRVKAGEETKLSFETHPAGSSSFGSSKGAGGETRPSEDDGCEVRGKRGVSHCARPPSLFTKSDWRAQAAASGAGGGSFEIAC